MMHGRGKSDEAIVAVKPANKAERSAAGVGGGKGGDQGECGPAAHAPDSAPHKRVTDAGSHTAAHSCRGYPRWEPYAGKLHVRICAGGAR
jgi:hypothetical protein